MTRSAPTRSWHPLEVRPYVAPGTPPYAQFHPRIIRFQNGRLNLRATLAALVSGQSILVRSPKLDTTKIKYAAVNAHIRIKIGLHPSLHTIVVTSLGPHRKRAPQLTRIAGIDPDLRKPRGPRFQGWSKKGNSTP